MKKQDQRIFHKRERAAERQVLRGGHSRVVNGDSWSHPATLIANDDEVRYPSPSKRKRPKKARCPVNRKHECLTEEREEENFWTGRAQTKLYKMCVHCGKEWVRRETPTGIWRKYWGKGKWRAINAG